MCIAIIRELPQLAVCIMIVLILRHVNFTPGQSHVISRPSSRGLQVLYRSLAADRPPTRTEKRVNVGRRSARQRLGERLQSGILAWQSGF